MSNNVVDFKAHQERAAHQKKEAGLEEIKDRFETAFPNEKSGKDKLLKIFSKKKKDTRTPKKK